MNLDPWPFYVDDGHFRVGNAGCNPCSAGLIWNMLHSQNIICASVHVQWNGQIYKLTVHLPSVSVCTSKGEKQRKWQTWWEATSGELLFFGDYNNNLQLECSKFLTLWITERTTDIIHLLRRWTTGHELGNHAITFNPWRYLAFQDIILFYTYMSNGYCPFMYLIFLDFGNVRVINCGQQQHEYYMYNGHEISSKSVDMLHEILRVLPHCHWRPCLILDANDSRLLWRRHVGRKVGWSRNTCGSFLLQHCPVECVVILVVQSAEQDPETRMIRL